MLYGKRTMNTPKPNALIRSEEEAINSVRRWVEDFVVGMNLCPFAKRELLNNRIRFVTTRAVTEEQLMMSLEDELELLNNDSSIETTLLIHSNVLQDFYDFNQFLNYADQLIFEMGLEGTYQIASFHPSYQYAGTNPEDPENYISRSPFPMLHLLREPSLERAIAGYPDIDQVPVRNVALMNTMGPGKLQVLFENLFKI